MDWNCPACLNGDLSSPTHQQASPCPISPVSPPPIPPLPTCSNVMDSSLPLPSHPPLLNTSLLFLLSFYFSHHQRPEAHNQSTTCHHTSTNSTPPQNLIILQWNAVDLSPSRRAELITFLSNNQYELILLQKTHLSATRKFQIPGYSTLHTYRTFARQGPVSCRGHRIGGGVLTLIHSDLAFFPVSVSSLSSQDTYSDYI